MVKDYTPVNSDFHDKLEALALEQKHCEVVFFAEGGRMAVQGRIERMYHKENMEFLRMQSGLEIRLDALIQVNGSLADPIC